MQSIANNMYLVGLTALETQGLWSSSAETLYNNASACSCSEIGALTLPPN